MNLIEKNVLLCYCAHCQKKLTVFLGSAEFSYSSLRLALTAGTSFELDLGFNPQSSKGFWQSSAHYNIKIVNDSKRCLIASFMDAKVSHELSKTVLSACNTRNYILFCSK